MQFVECVRQFNYVAGACHQLLICAATHETLYAIVLSLLPAGLRYAQERQQWDHDRSDWEHWKARLQEDLDAARSVAGLDLRKSMATQLAEAEARAGAERANLDRWAGNEPA